MPKLPEIITNRIMRYLSHPKAYSVYNITTPTDIGVIIRPNDKVFWARNISNPTMEEFYEICAMGMYGCINTKFNLFFRYNLKINFMSISIEIQ